METNVITKQGHSQIPSYWSVCWKVSLARSSGSRCIRLTPSPHLATVHASFGHSPCIPNSCVSRSRAVCATQSSALRHRPTHLVHRVCVYPLVEAITINTEFILIPNNTMPGLGPNAALYIDLPFEMYFRSRYLVNC